MLSVSQWVLRALVILNFAVGIPLLLVLGYSYIEEERFLSMQARIFPGGDVAGIVGWSRLALAMIAPVIVAAHLLLTRLLAMLRTVEAGDPFVLANADRLRLVAWCLLAIQLCDVGFGFATDRMNEAAGLVAVWSPSLTGWIAVLLIFILAQVFRDGARLRDDAELTI